MVVCLPRWRPALRGAGLILAGFVVVLAPWGLRMLAEHGAPSTSGGLGRSLIARSVKYAPEEFVDWKWLSETYAGHDDSESRARILLYNKRRTIRGSRSVRGYQDGLIEELKVTPAQADRLMRDVALEAIARRPLDYLRDSLRFSGQLLVGTELSPRSEWRQRQEKSWAEQWPDRLDALVEPVSPAQQRERPLAEWLLGLFQPAHWSALLLPLAALGTVALARSREPRPGLLLPASVLLLIGLSAFLDGPVPRYRVPLEPLLAILAAGGVTTALGLARLLRPAELRHPDGDEPAVQRAF